MEGVMGRVAKTPTATELMRILDAVYDVQRPKEEWFSGLLRSAAPILDQGAGIGGLLYDIANEEQINVEFIEGIDVPAGWRQAGLAIHHDPRFIPKVIASYRSSLCATLPQLLADPDAFERLQRDYYDRHAVRGQIMINGVDSSGKGCLINLFASKPIAISDGQRDLLVRLATHLSTAYRLQRRLADHAGPPFVGVAAVLTPEGRLEHAETDAQSTAARQHLAHAVRRRERARTFADMDAQRVMRSLKGMVSARWTLVDHYEHSGRRYVLARENAPTPVGPVQLSLRERQVVSLATLGRSNKLIAYELGLASSTIRVLMARACAKLGVATRSELIAKQRRTTGPITN